MFYRYRQRLALFPFVSETLWLAETSRWEQRVSSAPGTVVLSDTGAGTWLTAPQGHRKEKAEDKWCWDGSGFTTTSTTSFKDLWGYFRQLGKSALPYSIWMQKPPSSAPQPFWGFDPSHPKEGCWKGWIPLWKCLSLPQAKARQQTHVKHISPLLKIYIHPEQTFLILWECERCQRRGKCRIVGEDTEGFQHQEGSPAVRAVGRCTHHCWMLAAFSMLQLHHEMNSSGSEYLTKKPSAAENKLSRGTSLLIMAPGAHPATGTAGVSGQWFNWANVLESKYKKGQK